MRDSVLKNTRYRKQDSNYELLILLIYKKKKRADSAIVAYGYDGREQYRDPVSGILHLASSIEQIESKLIDQH